MSATDHRGDRREEPDVCPSGERGASWRTWCCRPSPALEVRGTAGGPGRRPQ